MVWFGTSIPQVAYDTFNSYPDLVADNLGMTCYNEAVGSSAARAGGSNINTPNGIFKGINW